ncbi:MAG: flagellar basal body P-ring formation chaperone FlgA [Planctomycetota bacterium]|nr:flagellar basal body P-ring formation protein FlgA [Planctomycetaceae bacterium]MDQ3332070.1 flagellar basal body P-ring formation chaperone FlgA [Planctomycetota bacterium]
MPTRTVALHIAAIIFVFVDSATAGVLVAFRDQATVERSLVTLGDVAELHSTEPADAQRLSAVILGPAPAAGRESPITFETVRSRLLSAGLDLADIQFSGPATVTVMGLKAASNRVSMPRTSRVAPPAAKSRIEQVVVEAIRRYLAVQSRGGSFEVSANVADDTAHLLATAETRGVDVSGGRAPWTGRQTFLLRVIDTAEKIHEVRVECLVSARPSVLATRQALPRGHVIGPDDLVWKKAESEAEAGCVTDPKELLGRETQQPLRSGQAIARDAVKTLSLVRNGQFVTVSSRRPGLAVQRVMKARADGALGEVIALQTLEDHKTILARVTGLLEADVVDKVNEQPHRPIIETGESVAASAGSLLPVAYEDEANAQPSILTSDTHRMHVNPTQPLSVPISMDVGGE